VATGVLVPWGGGAQAQFPETFENLKVLPKDTSREQLSKVMRGFSTALAVRCVYCHVGEDNPGLKGIDFKSDEKETKRVARAMMKMEAAINADYIGPLGRTNPTRVECETCHHGLARPRTLQAELSDALASKGMDGLQARYRELRQALYGRGAYDFGPGTLNSMAEERLRRDEAAPAAAILALNLEFNSDAWTHYLLGQAHEELKEPEKARADYEKALRLDPKNPMPRRRLDALSSPPPSPAAPKN